MNIEITNYNASVYTINNIDFYNIEFSIRDKECNEYTTYSSNIKLQASDWKRSVIISKLIRHAFSQDQVEAIINNHLLLISDWVDAKIKGENVEFVDPDYEALQSWRIQCKNIADGVLKLYPEV